MSAYDSGASDFNRRRELPPGVPDAIRAAVLKACVEGSPRLLDVGAGAGRIGLPFVSAGDRYTGCDLSFGMLRVFASQAPARLVRADGALLPFRDKTFDAVVLVQVLSSVPGWRQLLTDAMRVLNPSGALIVGRVIAPDRGIDARMKGQLAAILALRGLYLHRDKTREDALAWLSRAMSGPRIVTVANWTTNRSPGAFLERHGAGARFSILPEPVRRDALSRLSSWATDQFGSLNASCAEDHRFELNVYRFVQGSTL
jgi:ubiquinone/menaquinone biosynthesis C-methylase UbiE